MNFQIVDVRPTSMKMIVTPSRSYNLKRISFVMPDDIMDAILLADIKIRFYVDGVGLYF